MSSARQVHVSWRIDVLYPDSYTSPDWHGVQVVLLTEFSTAVWERFWIAMRYELESQLASIVFERFGMPSDTAHTRTLLEQVRGVIGRIEAEVRRFFRPQIAQQFAAFWPTIQRMIQGRLETGQPGAIIYNTSAGGEFSLKQPLYAFMLPNGWNIGEVVLEVEKVRALGVITLHTSLEPELGSPAIDI